MSELVDEMEGLAGELSNSTKDYRLESIELLAKGAQRIAELEEVSALARKLAEQYISNPNTPYCFVSAITPQVTGRTIQERRNSQPLMEDWHRLWDLTQESEQ